MRNLLKFSVCGISAATALGAISPLHAETVQEAVQHALRFNPDVLYQTAKKLSTEQGVRQAKGAFFPTVDMTAGIGRENSLNPTSQVIDPSNSLSTGNGITLTRKESTLELSQNLYAGGGIMGEFERKENLYNAEVLKVFGVADDTALKVVEQYLNVLKGRQMVAYARENLSKHLKLQGMIKDRNEAGLERNAESEQARGRVALARANLIAEQANLRESKINYLRIVGAEAHSLEWPQIPSSKDLPTGSDDAVNYAILNHPTLKSAYSDVEEAKSQHKVANATNYPRVDLVFSATRGEDLSGLIGLNQSTSAMVRMSYNLFRGGSDLAHQRETAYQVQEAYEVKNRTYEQVKESMRLSWNALITAQARLVPLRNYRDASGKTLEAYMEEFKLAKRTLLDLLDSTNEHYQAKLNYLDGVYKEMYARYRILNSAGRLVPYLAAYSPIEIHNTDFMTSHEFFDHGGVATAENRNMNRLHTNVPQASDNVPMVHTSTTDNLMQLTELHGDSVLASPIGTQLASAKVETLSKPEAVVADRHPEPDVKPEVPKISAVPALASLLHAKSLKTLAASTVPDVVAVAKANTGASPAEAPGAKAWYIQAGTFAQADHAQHLLDLLQSKGFEQAFLMKNHNFEQVYIGPYQYRGEAVAAETAIKTQMGVSPVLAYFALNPTSQTA